MCYYITAVLPSGANWQVAQAIAERHSRNLKAIDNPGIQGQLRAGEQYFLTTAGHCDCDTSLGLAERKRPAHQSRAEAKAKKLAALGWSKSKIERALSQSANSHERSEARALKTAEADAEAWINLIAELHEHGLPYVGLLLHFYDGPLSQNVPLTGRQTIGSGSQARQVLPRMSEDCLYEFRSEV